MGCQKMIGTNLYLAMEHELELLALIPYDKTVVKADRLGEAPLNYAETSESVKAIQTIGDKLLEANT